MTSKKLALIDEQSSPLFRIMWVNNFDEPARRQFENNICAFHIGYGYVLSVAHNLRSENKIVKVIDPHIWESEIQPKLSPQQSVLFHSSYRFDAGNGKRYLQLPDTGALPALADLFRQIGFDTRWISLGAKKISRPYLIVQFREALYYRDRALTGYFNPGTFFNEPTLNRSTFLLELELVEAFYSDDISLYRVVNTDPSIIRRLPTIQPDFRILDDTEPQLYCLQSAPGSFLGRLLNHGIIEGYLDNWNTFPDAIGGHYIMDGNRYLIRGYFRFGSSGAPYVVYDEAAGEFRVNAVQSEASPLQLSINNSQEGNFQYVNAIAAPLNNIQTGLESRMQAV